MMYFNHTILTNMFRSLPQIPSGWNYDTTIKGQRGWVCRHSTTIKNYYYYYYLHFVGNLYIMDVINARKMEHIQVVPLQTWSGPEGSGKLRFPDFMTTAQDSGKTVSLTHRPPLPPGNTPGTHFC